MFCAATGELIGVKYLFSQTGKVLEDIPDDPDVLVVEEEREEEEEEDDDDNNDWEQEVDYGAFHELLFGKDDNWEQEEGDDGGFQELLFGTDFLV